MPSMATTHDIIKKSLEVITNESGIKDYEHAFISAEKKLSKLLPDFGDDLTTCAKEIMRKAFALNDDAHMINVHTKTSGLSGNPVLFVETQKKTRAVIKAFPLGNGSFAKEVFVQGHLNDLGIDVPKLFDASTCTITTNNMKRYMLLASEHVEGILLDELIIEMAQMHDKDARVDALNKVRHITNKVGELLGNLHTSGPTFYGPQSSIMKKRHEQFLNSSLVGLRNEKDRDIDVNDVERFGHKIIDEFIHHEYRHAYVHGDAHPGNYMYESQRDRVVMLDVEDGAFFIGPHFDEPKGSPYSDYLKMVASLKMRQKLGLTEEEILAVTTSFNDGYLSAGGSLPEPSTKYFYTVMEIFNYFSWYFEHKNTMPIDKKHFMQKIFQTGTAWLKDCIKKQAKSLF